MIKELIKLANDLDARGLAKEADYLDKVIKRATDEDYNLGFLPDESDEDFINSLLSQYHEDKPNLEGLHNAAVVGEDGYGGWLERESLYSYYTKIMQILSKDVPSAIGPPEGRGTAWDDVGGINELFESCEPVIYPPDRRRSFPPNGNASLAHIAGTLDAAKEALSSEPDGKEITRVIREFVSTVSKEFSLREGLLTKLQGLYPGHGAAIGDNPNPADYISSDNLKAESDRGFERSLPDDLYPHGDQDVEQLRFEEGMVRR